MSTLHYHTPTFRSTARIERLILVLGICLPVPALAATGMTLPMPSVVERIAAALVPWAEDATLAAQPVGAGGAIVLTRGERRADRAAVAGVSERAQPAPPPGHELKQSGLDRPATPRSAPGAAARTARRTAAAAPPRSQAPPPGAPSATPNTLPATPAGSNSSVPQAPSPERTADTPHQSVTPRPITTAAAPTPPPAPTTTEPKPTIPIPTPTPTPAPGPVAPVVKTVEPVVETVQPVVETVVDTTTTTVDTVTTVVDTVTGLLPKPGGGLLQPRFGK